MYVMMIPNAPITAALCTSHLGTGIFKISSWPAAVQIFHASTTLSGAALATE